MAYSVHVSPKKVIFRDDNKFFTFDKIGDELIALYRYTAQHTVKFKVPDIDTAEKFLEQIMGLYQEIKHNESFKRDIVISYDENGITHSDIPEITDKLLPEQNTFHR